MAKSFSNLLKERSGDDRTYRLHCEIDNLHAVQGRNDGTRKLSHQSINETKDTEHTEGVPEGDKASPVNRRRGRRVQKEKDVQMYQFERSGPDTILLEVGGPYGLFGKALRDAVIAKDKAKYWLPGLSLVAFKAVESLSDQYVEVKAKTEVVQRMEPRNSAHGGRSMVAVFHERLSEPIRVTVDMVINAECPRSTEEIVGLLHAMQAVPFGPAKRGKLTVRKVE